MAGESQSQRLRRLRAETVLNLKSKVQETILADALVDVVARLQKSFKVELRHDSRSLKPLEHRAFAQMPPPGVEPGSTA
jgi:hypothetical protein